MATWAELERNAPALADAGRKLIYQFGQMGLTFLATVRKDGGPRLHPICITIVDGGLYAFILSNRPNAPTCAATAATRSIPSRRWRWTTN